MNTLSGAMEATLDPAGWLTGDDTEPYHRDFMNQYGQKPLGVARPRSTDEVASVVRACHAAGVLVVPQGGNTGLCGGSVDVTGKGVIVSLSRMNAIGAIDAIGRSVEVEAGAVLQSVHDAVAVEDFSFPLRLGSEGSAQIGGLIATNAGGSHALRYGMMQDLILGLEVVLPDGSVWNGIRPVVKDNAGYQLRRLFCGSEGTLGIVTRATLRLFPRPNHSVTALVVVDGMREALQFSSLLRAVADEFLTGLEFLSDLGVELVLKHFSDLTFPLESRSSFYLLVELSTASDRIPLDMLWEDVLERAMNDGLVVDGAMAANERQRESFWRLREKLPEGQRREGLQIKNDVSVPIGSLDRFLLMAQQGIATVLPGVRINPFGHLGDGNIHYNLSPPDGETDFLGRDSELRQTVANVVQSLGGSFAAEHGLGRTKVFLADALRSGPERKLMHAIKRAFDPSGLFNPGVVVAREPSGH